MNDVDGHVATRLCLVDAGGKRDRKSAHLPVVRMFLIFLLGGFVAYVALGIPFSFVVMLFHLPSLLEGRIDVFVGELLGVVGAWCIWDRTESYKD